MKFKSKIVKNNSTRYLLVPSMIVKSYDIKENEIFDITIEKYVPMVLKQLQNAQKSSQIVEIELINGKTFAGKVISLDEQILVLEDLGNSLVFELNSIKGVK